MPKLGRSTLHVILPNICESSAVVSAQWWLDEFRGPDQASLALLIADAGANYRLDKVLLLCKRNAAGKHGSNDK